MTVSPRTNSLLMYRSRLTGLDFFLPLPAFGLRSTSAPPPPEGG